jgi:membrane protease YdiL (CAAX protease family)
MEPPARSSTASEPAPSHNLLSRMSHWAPVRILVYIVAIAFVVLVSAIVSHKLIPQAPSTQHHDLLILINLLSASALIAVYSFVTRRLEQRPPTELSIRIGYPLFLTGVAAGVALMALVYIVLWGLGRATFTVATGIDGLGGSLAAYFAAAILEELVFRAVIFRIVEQMAGTILAIIVSAGLFALLHSLNPGVTGMGIVSVALAAITFALLYALTRNLWLVIGVHLGWNFAEGSLFGAQVSGSGAAHSLLTTSLTGPDLLTGGSFGPEGSIITTALYLLLAAALAFKIAGDGAWRGRQLKLSLE